MAESAIVVGVDAEDRHRELPADHLQSLGDQRLFPGQQGHHLGPARADVRGHEAPQENRLHGAAPVRDEVDLQVTGWRLFPVRKGAYRELLTGLRRFLPLLAALCGGAPHGGQQPVDGRRAGGQEAPPDRGVEGQVAVLLQGGDQGRLHGATGPRPFLLIIASPRPVINLIMAGTGIVIESTHTGLSPGGPAACAAPRAEAGKYRGGAGRRHRRAPGPPGQPWREALHAAGRRRQSQGGRRLSRACAWAFT